MPEEMQIEKRADADGRASTTKASTRIVVNRRLVDVAQATVNHAQLVGIAHPGIAMSRTRAFTVAFSRGGVERTTGFVAPGEIVQVIDQQEFHVAVAELS